MKEQSHCRKPDCKYHPDQSFLRIKYSEKRCIKCKYFVSRDFYVPNIK